LQDSESGQDRKSGWTEQSEICQNQSVLSKYITTMTGLRLARLNFILPIPNCCLWRS